MGGLFFAVVDFSELCCRALGSQEARAAHFVVCCADRRWYCKRTAYARVPESMRDGAPLPFPRRGNLCRVRRKTSSASIFPPRREL